jgi:hypothetical protein
MIWWYENERWYLENGVLRSWIFPRQGMYLSTIAFYFRPSEYVVLHHESDWCFLLFGKLCRLSDSTTRDRSWTSHASQLKHSQPKTLGLFCSTFSISRRSLPTGQNECQPSTAQFVMTGLGFIQWLSAFLWRLGYDVSQRLSRHNSCSLIDIQLYTGLNDCELSFRHVEAYKLSRRWQIVGGGRCW